MRLDELHTATPHHSATTGNYNTREDLIRAILHKSKTLKMSHQNIGDTVGVSKAIVQRILSNDAPEYRDAKKNVEELGSRRLNQFWKVPGRT